MTAAATIVIAQCGGGPGAPTAPSGPTVSHAAPIVTSVTLERPRIEAGRELEIVAAVENGGTTPDRLQYIWAVQPAGGAWTGEGARVRWRAPTTDPVPATYTFTVTVADPFLQNSTSGTGSSDPLWVNDWRREMSGHAEAFLRDFSTTNVSPDFCVRNFADSCNGKRKALEEIVTHRATYSVEAMDYRQELAVRSVEWANCTASDGSARCALLIYSVDWVWTRRAEGAAERVRGEEYLRGVYERNRWWLCEASFSPTAPPSP